MDLDLVMGETDLDTTVNERERIILTRLQYWNMTANEVIKAEHAYTVNRPGYRASDQDPNFYTHINKCLSTLEKKGLIQHLGESDGMKLWQITHKGYQTIRAINDNTPNSL